VLSYYATLSAIAAVLFALPCVLPRRWLCGYVSLAAIGITATWWDYLGHEREMGVVGVFSLGLILAGTAAAIAGLLARLTIMALRARRVRWRCAWLPAPLLFALLVASPFLLRLYAEFDNRPPPEACLLASHRLELAGATLSVPPAPVFIVIPADEMQPYGLAWPDKARAFCRMIARADPLPVRRVSLDFARHHGPLYRHEWHPLLCAAIRGRPWLHRLCDGPALAPTEHYPQWLSLGSAAEMTPGSYADIWALLRHPAEPIPAQTDARRVLYRLRADDGTPIAAGCWLYNAGKAECDAVFEPRPGLAAQFQVSVARDQAAAQLTAVQRRAAEIIRDLLQP
jgi:hypothetical protein